MKMSTVLNEGYISYVLSNQSRIALLHKFRPKYPDVFAHHITINHGVNAEKAEKMLPWLGSAKLEVVGIVDDGDTLEALIVSVNGTTERNPGETWHITWSTDGRPAKDSNEVIRKEIIHDIDPIEITAGPRYID